MRGEYPDGQPAITSSLGSPPLARGIQSFNSVYISSTGITPACAGNTQRQTLILTTSKDHPRLRGEYFGFGGTRQFVKGSPPLARGIPFLSWDGVSNLRITPACAGNTIINRCSCDIDRDHPRLRGEYAYPVALIATGSGSPPLARGIPTFQ